MVGEGWGGARMKRLLRLTAAQLFIDTKRSLSAGGKNGKKGEKEKKEMLPPTPPPHTCCPPHTHTHTAAADAVPFFCKKNKINVTSRTRPQCVAPPLGLVSLPLNHAVPSANCGGWWGEVVVGGDEGVDSARELHMGAVFKEKKMRSLFGKWVFCFPCGDEIPSFLPG